MKQHARIDEWVYDGYTLVGKISNHPQQERFVLELQQTSRVLKFDPENNLAETLNTIYELGTPYVHP